MDQHFNAKLKVHVDKDYNYFVSEFKRRFKELKRESIKLAINFNCSLVSIHLEGLFLVFTALFLSNNPT